MIAQAGICVIPTLQAFLREILGKGLVWHEVCIITTSLIPGLNGRVIYLVFDGFH